MTPNFTSVQYFLQCTCASMFMVMSFSLTIPPHWTEGQCFGRLSIIGYLKNSSLRSVSGKWEIERETYGRLIGQINLWYITYGCYLVMMNFVMREDTWWMTLTLGEKKNIQPFCIFLPKVGYFFNCQCIVSYQCSIMLYLCYYYYCFYHHTY